METLIVWFSEIHWVAVLQIIMIDILLGGDNAVVIALACRDLDPHLRWKGIFYGAGRRDCASSDSDRVCRDDHDDPVPEVLRRDSFCFGSVSN